MFERIIVNQIEMLSDNQVQDDFEKDLTARQRKYLRRTHAVSPFGETSKCAYVAPGETGKCAYGKSPTRRT